MIKIKTNKSINKQTNKQINILYPKYLSQIKLDLHKIFWVTSRGWAKMIEIKNKQIYKQRNKQTNK